MVRLKQLFFNIFIFTALFGIFSADCISAAANDPEYIDNWAINAFTGETGATHFYMYTYDDSSNTRLQLSMMPPTCEKSPILNIEVPLNERGREESPIIRNGTIQFDTGKLLHVQGMITRNSNILGIIFHKDDALAFIEEATKARNITITIDNTAFNYNIKGIVRAYRKTLEICQTGKY